MAKAVLGDESPRRVGAFSLRAAQCDAVQQAERALAVYGGALIADAPGSGKTVLALAIAARYDDVLVIVPAALREQWQRAATQAGVTARVETVEGLSHGRIPQPAALIIVDEAHHLRTPTTARYRSLAQLAMQRHLLLLTATPVVNSLRDRDALLALFLGERAARLSEAVRAAVILRLASQERHSDGVRELPPLRSASSVMGLAEALESLPPPLPVSDGAQASAIVRLTLAFAWASSLAALDAALRRRIERGRTLDDHLAAGQWPARDALRAWITGDDATQLAFAFDFPDAVPAPADARDVLARHLSAVYAMRALIAPHLQGDIAARALSLKELLAVHVSRRVVVLAHSAVTVRALYAALRTEPGVVAITGSRVQTAAGRWTREEVLNSLGPSAGPFAPRDRRGIRLLLASDILAEGVELQGASILVHADPTWTPARREQRLGRLAREGQREQVLVTQFAIPTEAELVLQLRDRFRHKLSARVTALRPAQAESLLRRRLHRWSAGGSQRQHDTRDAASPWVAAIRAAQPGFVALLRDGRSARLLSGEHVRGRWRIRDSPTALLRAIPTESPTPARLSAAQLGTVHRVIRRWHREQRGEALAADSATLPESILRTLRSRLESGIADAPLGLRAGQAREASDVLSQMATLRGRGAEQLLTRLLRSPQEGGTLSTQLRALVGAAGSDTPPPATPQAGSGRLSIEALLILVAEPPATDASGPALA